MPYEHQIFGKHGIDTEERINYERLRKERLQKGLDQMNKDGLGAILTFDADSIRYLAAHYITTPMRAAEFQFVLLPRNSGPYVFLMGNVPKYKEMMPWLEDRVLNAPSILKLARTPADAARLVELVAGILADHGLTSEPLGIEGSTTELLLAEAFKQKGIKIVNARSTMLDARTVKTRDEIALMRITCQNCEPAFAAIQDAIRPGIRETDLVAIAMKVLYEQGDDHTEDCVVNSGYNTNPYDVTFRDKPIRPGELIYIDIDGASYQGYKSCCYRTFSCGKATQEQKEIYEVTRRMLYDAMSAIKPGNTTLDVCEKMPTDPKFWGRESWEEVLPYACGHGLGLSLHEAPLFSYPLSKEHPVKLEEGMVFALETWYGQGNQGVRLEENLVVTKDGYELLTWWPIDNITECWT